MDTRAFNIRPIELVGLSPLIVACVVGLLLGVVEFGIFMQLPLVALVLIYVFWITPNYFFEIVEHRALGNDGWPVFSQETLVAGRNQIGIVFSVLVLVVAGCYVVLRHFGMDSTATTLAGAGLALAPASVALLAVTRDFRSALNPQRVLAAAAGMGHAYFYCLVGAAANLALIAAAQVQGGLWYFPMIYGLFLQAFMTGSIVYARRNVLGVHAPRSPEVRAERARREAVAIRNGILTHAYGLAARGNSAGALQHIESYLATDEDTLEARLWLLNETARWDNPTVALELGRRIAEYCDRNGFADEAARARLLRDRLSAGNDPGADR